MGTFILIAIAVAVIYFIFQIVDTSPVNKYYFNYTGTEDESMKKCF